MTEQLSLEVKPDWSEIDGVRERAEEFLSTCGLDREVVDALVMVVCELLENANKYGQFGDAKEKPIQVAVDADSASVTVEVKNPVEEPEAEHLRRLDSMIQWIRGYQDPFQAYLERVKDVSAQGLDSRESGLGLVRIAYEGQAILDFYLDQDDTLAVSAVYQL